jgi:hypothetical protein
VIVSSKEGRTIMPLAEEVTPLHWIKCLEVLTKEDLLKWISLPSGIFTSEAGPFRVSIDPTTPYSKEKPCLTMGITRKGGLPGYDFYYHLAEVAPLLELVTSKTSLPPEKKRQWTVDTVDIPDEEK